MQRTAQKLGDTRIPEHEAFIKDKLYILVYQIFFTS